MVIMERSLSLSTDGKPSTTKQLVVLEPLNY